MSRRTASVAWPLLLAALAGCGGAPEPPARPDDGGAPAAPPAASAPTGSPAGGYSVVPVPNPGRVSGRIRFGGSPPAPAPIAITKDVAVCGREKRVSEDLVVGPGGGIANAVVSLRGVTAGKAFGAGPAPVLDQRGCWFHPRVQVVPAGATLEILNNDGILHNVHTYPGSNPPVNMAQPKFRKVLTTSFARPDVVKVACDVHAWMTAWIIVAEHPYHAVTGADGGFVLEGVPPGSYTLHVWHESLGTREQPIEVGPGGAAEANLTFG
jgi:plastocyanin